MPVAERRLCAELVAHQGEEDFAAKQNILDQSTLPTRIDHPHLIATWGEIARNGYLQCCW